MMEGVEVALWEGLFVPHGTDKKIVQSLKPKSMRSYKYRRSRNGSRSSVAM